MLFLNNTPTNCAIKYRLPVQEILRTTAEDLSALIDTLEVMVIHSEVDFITLGFSDYWLWLRHSSPEAFEFVLNQDLVQSHIESFEDGQILCLLGDLLENFGATPSKVRKRLIKRFVKRAMNIYHANPLAPPHAPMSSASLIDRCFYHCQDPTESRAMADEWLKILSSSGVNIHDYLKTEVNWHTTKPPLIRRGDHLERYYRRLVFSLEEPPTVQWEWWVNPREPGGLVLGEFREMCRIGDRGRSAYPRCPSDWPYGRPLWMIYYYSVLDENADTVPARTIRLANERFERRMQKKAGGRHKVTALDRRLRMPGAWIE